MISDVLKLIAVTVTKDSIGQAVMSETEKQVFCSYGSVSGNEWARAGQNGINAEYTFSVFSGDYSGETLCEFHGQRYRIYRTYLNGDSIELYAEKAVGVTYGSQS